MGDYGRCSADGESKMLPCFQVGIHLRDIKHFVSSGKYRWGIMALMPLRKGDHFVQPEVDPGQEEHKAKHTSLSHNLVELASSGALASGSGVTQEIFPKPGIITAPTLCYFPQSPYC